ncbi:hypothetical protein [Aquimonas sp.]|uniref:hypothetical protein n=1 Tax=Aquimonas sp. TaxID=1872588 RepID=UPI0037BF5F69
MLEIVLLVALIAITTAVMLSWVGGIAENVSDGEHVTGMEELAQNIGRHVRDVGTVSQMTSAHLVASGIVPVRLRTPDMAQPIKGPRNRTIEPWLVRLYSPTEIDTVIFAFELGPASAGAQVRLCQAYAEMGQRAYDIVRIGSETLKQPGPVIYGADRIAAAVNAQCGTGANVFIQLGIVAA